ncbi:MAG TPA: hypothetical protein VG820_03260 [Fimbriimonadaceae bacterium]|nr:hypothetical protein [Fimbriimonadaceae bacterium]
MLIVAAACATAFPQGFTEKVSFMSPAAPAGVALSRLAEISHVPLYADRTVKDEPLILRFNEVPLQAAMDKIAEVTSATWVKTDQGYELIRTPDIARRLESEELANRTAKIAQILNMRTKDLFAFNPSTASLLADLMKPPEPPVWQPDKSETTGSESPIR